MSRLKRAAAVVGLTAILVVGNSPLLFGGHPPGVVHRDDGDRWAAVLFFVPMRVQQIVAVAAVLVYVVVAWRDRMDDEARAAREAADLERYRARFHAERENGSRV